MAETSYTAEQLRVIEHEGRHAVVSAVAGSGKTETLIGRVRHLLRTHAANQIAVVMFNKDAATAFRRRFEARVGGPMPEIRTFNSMGNKIVNRLVELGHLPEADISSKDYQRAKMARACFTAVFRGLNGDDTTPDKELVDDFISFISLVKTDTRSVDEVFGAKHYSKAAEGFPEAFALFEKTRIKAKVRYYEDQLFDPTMLLLRKPALQTLVTNRVDHLIVDEAQDMNGIQIALLRVLAGTRANVMIVGDEDQAIYEWRGAKPDYITRGFEADFNSATRYTMPHTFRFGHTLSLAASHLIVKNANRNPKISISAANTPETEITSIGLTATAPNFGSYIQDELDAGRKPDEIAVLVRNYSMVVSLELDLHSLGIPYFVYGRPPLLRIPEISALIGVLQLSIGRWKALAADDWRAMFRSLLSMPSLYLSTEVLRTLVDQAIEKPDELSSIVRSAITEQMPSYQADQIRDRADLLEIIATATEEDESPHDIIVRYLSGTQFEKSIRKQAATGDHAEAILVNVNAFKEITAKHVGTIAEFLDDIDPLIDSKNLEPPTESHVWISSIHRAKGAQWPAVFVPGLAAGAFPRRSITVEEEEAERRLCYVAITRAVDKLFLVHPEDADFKKSCENIDIEVVRPYDCPTTAFLWEMELAVARYAGKALTNKGPFKSVAITRPNVANAYFKRFPFSEGWSFTERVTQPRPALVPSGATAPSGALQPGVRVEHFAFGQGVLEDWVDAKVFRVRFDNGDTKMFVAKYTPIRVL